MTRFQCSIELDHSADVVWSLVATYELDPVWRGEVVSMSSSPGGIVRPGTRTDEVARVLGSTFTTPGEVLAVDGRSFSWRAMSRSVDASGERTVDDLGAGRSRLTLGYDVSARGGTRLVQPLLVGALRRQVAKNLTGLAALLAAGPPYGRSASASSRVA